MKVDQKTLREIQQTELKMLYALDACCKQLQIPYYLIGGSALGAVRHEGFIPWDDDIDVGMLRPDYEKFLSGAQALLPEFYFLQCPATEPELPFNFTKLRDSRTTFIEFSVKKRKINHGVYIDVFPLDYYPTAEKEQKRIDRKNRLLSLRIRRAFTMAQENRSKLRILGGKCLGALLTIKYPTVRSAVLAREALYRSVPRSGLIQNYGGAWGRKEIVPQEWFGEGAEAVFEGLAVRIPKAYDSYLTQLYGNYMRFPPEEQRQPHHNTDVIDLHRPYTDYAD